MAGASMGLVAILLLVGGMTFASPASLATPSHRAAGGATSAGPDMLLQQARASAAHGHGPGAAAAPLTPRPSSGPNVSFGIVMTYDAFDGYVLAVSLNDSAGPANNTYGPTQLTWEFAGGNWSLLNTTGNVPATLGPALVYDAHDQYVLLYGGRLMDTSSSVAPLTNQTWSYRAGVWSNLTGSGSPAPFAVDFANLVYDAADEYVLLYDEVGILASNGSETLETTWSYAAGVWTDLTATAGTTPAFWGQMAYDAADHYVVYFGGYTLSDTLSNATFTFHGGAWTNATASVHGGPSARYNYGMAYDDALREVVLYGGIVQDYVITPSMYSLETWAYSAGNWTLLATNGSAYVIQTMVYDAATNQTILLGSTNFYVAPPNVVTLILTGGSWTVGAPAFAPSARVADAGQAFTLYVTQSPNGGDLTYQYVGLPSSCASVDASQLTCVPTASGNYSIQVTVTGAAGFFATARTTIVVNLPPTVLQFGPTAALGEVGVGIGFSVAASAGSGGLTYSYIGLPPGCASTNAPQLQCTPTAAGTFDITADVTDGLGVTALGTATLQVVPALAVSALGLNRAVLDAGQSLEVQASLAGGAAPFTYVYSGLPTGCSTPSGNSFTCAPSADGTYSIGVQVTDSLGAHGLGSTSLLVNALPTIQSLRISNPVLVAGGSTELTIAVSGGTAPFVYQYSGLPTGCTGVASADVSCSALTVGNYTVTVVVVDATGARTSATGTFSVTAPSTIPVGPGPIGPDRSTPAAPAGGVFWWGFAVGTVAIAIAAIAGGYRLVMARQGRAIVRGLRMGKGEGTADPATDPASPPTDGERDR